MDRGAMVPGGGHKESDTTERLHHHLHGSALWLGQREEIFASGQFNFPKGGLSTTYEMTDSLLILFLVMEKENHGDSCDGVVELGEVLCQCLLDSPPGKCRWPVLYSAETMRPYCCHDVQSQVAPDSLLPRGLRPARFLRPWEERGPIVHVRHGKSI